MEAWKLRPQGEPPSVLANCLGPGRPWVPDHLQPRPLLLVPGCHFDSAQPVPFTVEDLPNRNRAVRGVLRFLRPGRSLGLQSVVHFESDDR